VGVEEDMVFSGESIISNYSGERIAFAGADEELLIAEVDMNGAAKARACKPYTSLRRPVFYK